MVMVFEGTDEEFHMDGYMFNVVEDAKKAIYEDWDMVFCIDGYEGVGKSVFAQQMAKACDPTLTLDRIVFTPEEFENAILKADKYQAIIYDEGYTGLSSRATMSKVNKTLVAMLAEIRQKNLFVFVVMPTFFDLDKYVAIWRSRALIHLYTADRFKRGTYAFYNIDKKKQLYINGKKFYSYSQPRPNFIARYPKHYTVNEKAYKEKKRKSLTNRNSDIKRKQLNEEAERILFDRLMRIEKEIPNTTKMAILNMPETTFYRKKREWDEKNQMEAIS